MICIGKEVNPFLMVSECGRLCLIFSDTTFNGSFSVHMYVVFWYDDKDLIDSNPLSAYTLKDYRIQIVCRNTNYVQYKQHMLKVGS